MTNLIQQMVYDAIMHLNQKTGKDFSNTEESTIKQMFELIKQGHTLDDFKTVIDKKWQEWKGTKFQDFVRPSTLFGKNFKKYLHEQRNTESRLSKVFKSVDKAKQHDWNMGSKR